MNKPKNCKKLKISCVQPVISKTVILEVKITLWEKILTQQLLEPLLYKQIMMHLLPIFNKYAINMLKH